MAQLSWFWPNYYSPQPLREGSGSIDARQRQTGVVEEGFARRGQLDAMNTAR